MFSQIFAASLNQSVVAGRENKTIATTVAVHRANTHVEVWRHSHAHGSIGRFIPRVPWSDSPGCPAQEKPEDASSQGHHGERVPRAAHAAGDNPGSRGDRPADRPDKSPDH